MFSLGIMAVLAFSLAVMAAVSAVLLSIATRRRIRVTAEGPHLHAFKGEEASVVVRVGSKLGWSTAQVVSFGMDRADVTKIDLLEPGRTRIHFVGKLAGRSKGVRVGLETADPLSLFQSSSEANCDLELDVLPNSLLAPQTTKRFPTVSQGELPAGSPGRGQELYGLEEYQTSSDIKDIVWSRVAKSPEENLIARIRESNIRKVVQIGIIQMVNRDGDWLAWMDTLCEGLASIGNGILQMGSSLTIVYQTDEGLVEENVSGPNELAEVIMSYSLARPSMDAGEVVVRSDMIITGLRELEDMRVAAAVAGKYVLSIYEKAALPMLSARSMTYSGKESLLPFIQRMMQR